jgi:hypothetical protein
MNPVVVTVTGVGVSRVITPDFYCVPFAIGIGCVITGTATYGVEHTFDDTLAIGFNPATATWFPNSGIPAGTVVNKDGNYAFPVRGIRLNVTVSTGSVTMTIVQATSH